MGNAYRELVERNRPPEKPAQSSESELDKLVHLFEQRAKRSGQASESEKPDPIQTVRELMLREFIPIFVELKEKYGARGISTDMDASNLLEGGREVRFEFGFGEYRTRLLGTVTDEAIAFHETRHAPDVSGELVSGPMLRLRNLDGKLFREFVCERLSLLLRTALRH